MERDLHDGAQQHLVALAINLRLARDVVADDPAAVGEMLDQLAEDVQLTIRELRELAHGIYPPLLADNGLADALRAAASRSPLTVRVAVADDVGRYPAEVEAAIYFSCLEALQNAAKHAPEATAELRLWTAAGGLLFSVTDDGPGFDRASGPARPRLRQHGGPARRHRRDRPLGFAAGRRSHDRRLGPAGLTRVHSRAKAPESRFSHSWRRASAPKRSLLT